MKIVTRESAALDQTIAEIRSLMERAEKIGYWRLVTSLMKAFEDLQRLRHGVETRGV